MSTPRSPRITPARHTRPLTVIVRAIPDAARDGRLAGRVEVVDTGESIPIRSADELLELLARLASDLNE